MRPISSTFYLFLAITTILFFLSGCMVFREHTHASQITRKNFKELSGVYSNLADRDEFFAQRSAGPGCVSRTFWENTYGCLNKNREIEDTLAQVRIDWQKPGRIQLTLEHNGEPVQARTIRGRIQKGHFISRQHFIVYPFFPLVFGYNSYRFRIGFSEGRLHLDSKGSYWGFALFGGGDGKAEYTTEYQKVE